MEKENAGGVHAGHRDRMKKRFLSTDGGGIADHEGWGRSPGKAVSLSI